MYDVIQSHIGSIFLKLKVDTRLEIISSVILTRNSTRPSLFPSFAKTGTVRIYRSAWKFVRERFYVAIAVLSAGSDGARVVVKQLYGVVRARNRYFINSIVIAGQSRVS